MPARTALAALVVAAAALVPAAAGGPAAAVQPKGLVLKAADVKPFQLQSSGALTLADAARGMPAGWREKLVRWGRQGGFESRFFDARSERYLISSAAVYGGAAGARAYLDAIFRSPPAPKGLLKLPLGKRVGEEMRLYVQYATQQGTRLQFLYLAWRERNVIGAIALGGLRGRVTADQAREFGRLQQVRIRRALASS